MTRRPLRNRSADVVFLAYHSVAEDGPPYTSVTPTAFERHIAVLTRLGYGSGGLADLERLGRGERTRERFAFLTFDDGYRDGGEIARPLLEAHGFRGLFFVLPPLVDDGAALSWPRVEGRLKDYPAVMRSLTWNTVEEMAASGHEIGSHTLTHPTLTELGEEALRQELLDSRRRIEERTGRCDALAYPFGLWSPRVAAAAADAGYSFAFTLPFGGQPEAGPLCIPRIAVDHRDDERRFRLKLRPAYRAFLLSRLKPAARRVLRRRPAHLSSG
jgi:peptidoglycan/xylan/chitin deacetylase (PgdA/CDA1 family)